MTSLLAGTTEGHTHRDSCPSCGAKIPPCADPTCHAPDLARRLEEAVELLLKVQDCCGCVHYNDDAVDFLDSLGWKWNAEESTFLASLDSMSSAGESPYQRKDGEADCPALFAVRHGPKAAEDPAP